MGLGWLWASTCPKPLKKTLENSKENPKAQNLIFTLSEHYSWLLKSKIFEAPITIMHHLPEKGTSHQSCSQNFSLIWYLLAPHTTLEVQGSYTHSSDVKRRFWPTLTSVLAKITTKLTIIESIFILYHISLWGATVHNWWSENRILFGVNSSSE